jgi:hypothetical protein
MSEEIKDAKPWDVLNPNTEYLSDEDANVRFSICKQCPELVKFTSQCRQCKCFMKLKTKMKHASCPIGKW